ncbi:MAG: DUF2155 domain-containing protein [Alphaproteobacteria bacterium]
MLGFLGLLLVILGFEGQNISARAQQADFLNNSQSPSNTPQSNIPINEGEMHHPISAVDQPAEGASTPDEANISLDEGMKPRTGAVLGALDKVTARLSQITLKLGETQRFGQIYMVLKSCYAPPPEEKPEAVAFLQVWEKKAEKDKSNWVYSGWMFASSPGLAAIDHPIYDVWLISCTEDNNKAVQSSKPVAESAKPAEKEQESPED